MKRLVTSRAFALVELLIVLAILLIVMGALAVAACRAIAFARSKAKAIKEYSDARLGAALDDNFTNQLFTVPVDGAVQAQP